MARRSSAGFPAESGTRRSSRRIDNASPSTRATNRTGSDDDPCVSAFERRFDASCWMRPRSQRTVALMRPRRPHFRAQRRFDRQLSPGQEAEGDAVRTAHAVHVPSVTRATAANPMPVVSHSTFNNEGTASMRAIVAMSRAMASARSSSPPVVDAPGGSDASGRAMAVSPFSCRFKIPYARRVDAWPVDSRTRDFRLVVRLTDLTSALDDRASGKLR